MLDSTTGSFERQIHPRVAKTMANYPVRFQVHRHASFAREIRTPDDVAAALEYELNRIAKTLYVRCVSGNAAAMVVIPAGRKVNLSVVAAEIGCRRVEIGRSEELKNRVGYPPGGVSPLGVDTIPVFMDRTLFDWPTILIGAGEEGIELELAPSDVQTMTAACVLAVSASR